MLVIAKLVCEIIIFSHDCCLLVLFDVCCWSVLLCVDCVLSFCDARYKRYLGDIGKDLLEKNQSLFL